MNTKELIKQLQEKDPEGDTECCIGNKPIYYIDRMPAYYDGILQILKQDLSSPYYNIIGAKFTSQGDKIKLVTHSINDALWENPDLPIELPTEYEQRHFEHLIPQWREDIKKLHNEMNEWSRYTGDLPDNTTCRFCAKQEVFGYRRSPSKNQINYTKWHKIKCIFKELYKVLLK